MTVPDDSHYGFYIRVIAKLKCCPLLIYIVLKPVHTFCDLMHIRCCATKWFLNCNCIFSVLQRDCLSLFACCWRLPSESVMDSTWSRKMCKIFWTWKSSRMRLKSPSLLRECCCRTSREFLNWCSLCLCYLGHVLMTMDVCVPFLTGAFQPWWTWQPWEMLWLRMESTPTSSTPNVLLTL